MSGDDPSQVERAHRAKRRGRFRDTIDGGAVSVGMVLPLAAFAPTLVLEMPAWLVVTTLAIGLFLGGFLARAMTSDRARCPACHGALVGVATVLVVGAVVIAESVAAGDTVSLELTAIAGADLERTAMSVGGAILIATVGGLVPAPTPGRNS